MDEREEAGCEADFRERQTDRQRTGERAGENLLVRRVPGEAADERVREEAPIILLRFTPKVDVFVPESTEINLRSPRMMSAAEIVPVPFRKF